MVGSVLEKAQSMVRDLERLGNDEFNNLRSGLKGGCSLRLCDSERVIFSLSGLYVETTHQTPSRNKQMFFIGDVHRENAHTTRFTDADGQMTTVAAYFEKKYQRLK